MSKSGTHILVVDDEIEIVRALRSGLTAHGYKVFTASSGEEAFEITSRHRPDLLLLDLLLPGMSGLEVCRRMREESNIPIIVLSVKGAERNKVEALDLGADDYLTKPFSLNELLARVRSVLRRAPQRQAERLRIDDLEIDMRRHKATRSGVPLNLTPKEFLLLAHLVRSAGEVVSRAELAEQVWEIGFKTTTNVVDVVVRRLRAKVDDPFKTKLIHTIRGVGYVLKAR